MGLDQIVFVFLIVFAVRAVFASCLKHAIITSGVFGLWASLAYLLYHAPDVAVSEAVVASSLGTVLLILAIRHYGDITVPGIGKMVWRRKGADLVIVGACALVLYLTAATPPAGVGALREAVMTTYLDSPRLVNPVTSVLLHYRVFDTVLEALMLLVAVLGVMHLRDDAGGPSPAGYGSLTARHPTVVKALQILTPVLIIVGLSLIVGDPYTPGGGFQGAGLLAAVIVSRYLIGVRGPASTKALETLEKVIFVVFVLSVGLYVFLGLRETAPDAYVPFVLAMNGLLGVKVFCGLSIMFLYFAREA
ncbi:hydrogenase subunit MbhD domain-containing protein [Xylanimonas ulmi]|uniref:Multisubunit sodium/proton antiporter MrpB subunit n=1 Tax=Xylanimonas ulmi TaxID=228973 RepID=A0A4Q7M2J7_9MICO|nr:hydrogenase subunit MbhD domain-containing protein [Xylanibacterium ulmi]RZS60822.1 multisubunit sodium/proton antiporter MrpB subunit [Xylanibacterium ulmi]